jgi:hypothetical protein
MSQWKPQNVRELFCPGYHDRLTWYTVIFGLVFGVLGALNLVTSVIQVGMDIAGLSIAQHGVQLQMAQNNVTGNPIVGGAE